MQMSEKWRELIGSRCAPDENGCWRWTSYKDNLGYGRVNKRYANTVKAHRASWVLSRGPIPDGMIVMHKCDVRDCVNPDHLRIGTQADNVADMIAKGRGRSVPKFGSKNPGSVLDEDAVWFIRAMLRIGAYTQAEMARGYNVSPMTLSRIANNQTWRHVTDAYPFQ